MGNFINETCVPQPRNYLSIRIDDRSIGFLWVIYPGTGCENIEETADIGYAISVDYWGKGIATKVLKMAIPQIFNDFPLVKKLQAYTFPENKASQRVLEKAGFIYQRSTNLNDGKHFNEYVNGVDLLEVYTLVSTNICGSSIK